MRALLALLLLLPGAAGRITVNGTLQAGSCGAAHTSVNGVCDNPVVFSAAFATPGCYTSPVADTGQALTITRATTESCMVGGVLTTCTANQLCVEDSTGALIQGATTNKVLQSEHLENAAWTMALSTITANQGVFIDGQTTMDLLANSAVGLTSLAYQGVLVTSSTGPWTASTWLRADSGTKTGSVIIECPAANPIVTCTCVRDDGGVCAAEILSSIDCSGYATVGTAAPVRLSVTATCTSAATTIYHCLHAGRTGTSSGQLYFGGMQFEAAAWASGYKPTTTVAVTNNATALSATNPLASTETSWCMGGTYTPAGGRAWAAITSVLGSLGTQAAANTATLESKSDGTLNLYTYNAGPTLKQGAYTHALVAGASSRLVACDAAGTLSLDVGTAPVVLTSSGAGDGVLASQPATLWIGGSNSGSQFAGNLKNFAVSRSAAAGRLP